MELSKNGERQTFAPTRVLKKSVKPPQNIVRKTHKPIELGKSEGRRSFFVPNVLLVPIVPLIF
jgi:hypothetical protein